MINTSNILLKLLFEDKVLTEEQYNLVKIEQANSGRDQEELIKEYGFANSEQITKTKAKIIGIPFIDIAAATVSSDVLNTIPEPVARRYMVLPFKIDSLDGSLLVAMKDPLDLQILEFIEKKGGKKVKPYIAIPEDLQNKITEQYSVGLSSEVSAALKQAMPEINKNRIDLTPQKMVEIIREAPVAKIVSTILEYAIKARASDIHIEPLEDKTRIRYRIDGILHEKLSLPKKIHEALVSRIKILSELKIDEKRLPQDGRFNFKTGDEEVDLRISTLPTVFGEKLVMRLLKKTGLVPTLPELGLRGLALQNLETDMLRPHGIILITGPTGSGKTTTLYSILSRINTTRINIVTLEDPVEYQIPGINQVQINPLAGLTFASGLRSFLRQDPNVILVGEIRDQETTDLAIQASLTGHLVFSTLHTNNASGALPRLLDLHAEPFLISSSVNCIVGQRICRKICPNCKEEFIPPSEIAESIKKVLGNLYYSKSPQLKLYRGKGCEECNKTGFYGRIGIFEVLPVSLNIAKLILERASSGMIEAEAKKEGMISMKQDGYLKVIEGITTIEEVLRVAQE